MCCAQRRCCARVCRIRFSMSRNPKKKFEWQYDGGLEQYLLEELGDTPILPEEPFDGSMRGSREEVDWSVGWVADGCAPP